MDLAVLFGGPSPEHDVSILTGLQASRGLAGSAQVRSLYWAKNGEWFEVDPGLEAADFLEGPPRKAKPLSLRIGAEGGFFDKKRRLDFDAALNCCHGGPGEDGALQGALTLAGIRYSGPRPAGAALGMDKLAFGGVIAAAGLPTLPRWLVTTDGAAPTTPPPYIVKPRFGGSSIGIEVVDSIDTARTLAGTSPHLRHGAIVEPYLPAARDLNIAVRTYPSVQLSAIEEPQRPPEGSSILGYHDKYLRSGGLAGAARQIPADIPPEIKAQIESAARAVAGAAEVRGVARLDFLLDGADLYVNELNTIPGLLASYLWVDPPLRFEALLHDLVEEAMNDRWSYATAGADGILLRSANTIAAKLGL